MIGPAAFTSGELVWDSHNVDKSPTFRHTFDKCCYKQTRKIHDSSIENMKLTL
jgi:hypothetical protein